MKNHRNDKMTAGEIIRCCLRAPVGLLLTAAVIASPFWLTDGSPRQTAHRIAEIFDKSEEKITVGGAAASETVSPSQITVTTAAPTTTAATAPTTAAPSVPDGFLPVKEVQYIKGNLSGCGIEIKNGCERHSPDISALLAEKPDFSLSDDGYRVLIIHTHTTECYIGGGGYYDPSVSPRTTDKSKNMVCVGDEIEKQLEAAGIKVLHVSTVHDYPAYNGSYDRAKQTITGYLEKYPSIGMVLDIHRDAITQQDGTKLKPTAVIDGKKAAQIMIVSGCSDDGALYFPDWEKNLRMAAHLQKRLSEQYPGLARPLYFAPYRYNMHLTKNSLLIEIGTDVNTLDEAAYSGKLFGKALASLLSEL